MKKTRLFVSRIFLLLVALFTCTHAQEFTHQEALDQYRALGLSLPSAESDGRIQTLNQKGAISPFLDYATQQFLNF